MQLHNLENPSKSPFLTRYFPHGADSWPTLEGELLPLGVLWTDIQSYLVTNLHKMPQLTRHRVFLIHAYEEHEENMESIHDWEVGSLDMSYAQANVLTSFWDNTLALSKSERTWWLFYYNQDVKACAIGRFQTQDTDEQVLAQFDAYADCLSLWESNVYKSKPVPATRIL